MVGGEVTEERDFLFDLGVEGLLAAADEEVGLDADGAKLGCTVLGGFGFQLAGGLDVGDEGDVDVDGVGGARFEAKLAQGFEEGERLDVADGAADFDDADVDVFRAGADTGFDLVGDVGDDLNGFAEVVAASLFGDDGFVDLSGGEVVLTGEAGVGEPLVVAEVEVGLRAVVGDVDFAVLVGGHRAGVDVDVGVEFEVVDLEAAGLDEGTDGSGGKALAE